MTLLMFAAQCRWSVFVKVLILADITNFGVDVRLAKCVDTNSIDTINHTVFMCTIR